MITNVKRYKIQHSIDAYTFPKEAYIHAVTFDAKYMQVELTDERVISIPLMWIPTLYNASDENRRKYEISQNRSMIIWDPQKSGINDEINIVDYLGPTRADEEAGFAVYAPAETSRQIAEGKTKGKKK
jgi:uncharacterized protein DUF2442